MRAIEALGPELLAHVEVEAKPVLVDDVIEGLVDMDQTADLEEIMAEVEADGQHAPLVARLDASASVRQDETLDLSVDVRKLHFFDLDSGDVDPWLRTVSPFSTGRRSSSATGAATSTASRRRPGSSLRTRAFSRVSC